MRQLIPAILLGGLCAGVMDITAACANGYWRNSSSPARVFQSVAGGWFGREAFQGGWKTAFIGLLIHFFIATNWAAVYALASLKLPWLTRYAIPFGVLYGVLVYLFMYGVILPLSAYHARFFNQSLSAILTGHMIHMLCVGLPIALVIRWQTK